MNQYDVAGVFTTYSERAKMARSSEHLKEIVRELKRELNADEIRKLKVER